MPPNCMGYIGFASYSLTNNHANIHRVEDQLKRAIALRETETTEEEIFAWITQYNRRADF